MTNLQKRVLVAFIYFPLLLLSAFDLRIFSVAVSVLLGLAWHEFLSMRMLPSNFYDWVVHFLKIFLGCLPTLLVGLPSLFGGAGNRFDIGVVTVAMVLQIYVVLCMIRNMNFSTMTQSLGFYVLGFIYVTGLFTALVAIRDTAIGGTEAVWFLFFIVGATDTGAYFTGRNFGKTPFFQNLSPKKTQEGLWGGLVSAFIVSVLFYFLFHRPGYSAPGLASCVFLGLVVALASVFGDLFESMLKRHFGVKDSGGQLPGHGGVLDRFDGLMFGALPLLFYILTRGGFQ